jgi:small nuclear ribonucleoprotein (snRNP)-like protein
MPAEPTRSIELLESLLRETLRILLSDGRIIIGTFVGTDKAMNILLVNTDEFRLGPGENPNGRFVGQVLVPWKFVQKVEVRATYGAGDLSGDEDRDKELYM